MSKRIRFSVPATVSNSFREDTFPSQWLPGVFPLAYPFVTQSLLLHLYPGRLVQVYNEVKKGVRSSKIDTHRHRQEGSARQPTLISFL